MGAKRQDQRARFYKFVGVEDERGCWNWQSTLNRAGYGKFWFDGRTALAHRVSYQLHKGEIPAGLQIRHACDNKRCINPAHLSVGTGKENARDALDRGNYRRGAENGRAKLTERDVEMIRDARAQGQTQQAIADEFGVSKSAIQWILNGRNWAAIGGAQ